jgi:hypothetical protein
MSISAITIHLYKKELIEAPKLGAVPDIVCYDLLISFCKGIVSPNLRKVPFAQKGSNVCIFSYKNKQGLF